MYTVAVATIFLLFNFNLNIGAHTLSLPPAFVGWWLLARGCRKFDRMHEPLAALTVPAGVMAALSGVSFLARLGGLAVGLPWSAVLACVGLWIKLVFLWRVGYEIGELDRRYRLGLPTEALRSRGRWYIGVSLFAAPLGILAAVGGSAGLVAVVWLAAVAVSVALCATFFRCAGVYRDRVPPEWRSTAE